MAEQGFFMFLLFSAILCFLINFLYSNYSRSRNLPPGPLALPVIGHLHLLKHPLHRCLNDLSNKYGHVMFLRFGARKVVVVSSPEAVEECFTKNDIIFSNRPSKLLAGKLLNYDNKTMGLAPYGDHWRNLKRLVVIELLSANRISAFSNIRQEEVHILLKKLYERSSRTPVKVELKRLLTDLSFNLIMRMTAGKRYYGEDAMDEEAKQFCDVISEVFELHGVSNLADALPVFQMVDIQGLKKRMMSVRDKLDNFLQKLVDEHRNTRSRSYPTSDASTGRTGETETTFIDVMLSLQETDPEYNSDENIKAMILTLVNAGTESLATTLEWAMTLLLNNPEAKEKALDEIERFVEKGHLMDETDIPKLNYLQGVINETFRLCPPAPLMAPRESSDDCKIGGFDIPKGTMLLVHSWRIQRDPKLWEDPTSFKPERYSGGEGEGYKLIPFGLGRRACPGANLGKKAVAYVLGSLIQCFDWAKEDDKEIDMTEGVGLTMPKKEPLEAICKPHENMIDLLAKL